MSVVQSFSLPTTAEQVHGVDETVTSGATSSYAQQTIIDKVALKTTLKTLARAELFDLLVDADIDLFKSERVAAQDQLELELKQQYQASFDEKLATAIAQIKAEVATEEASRQQQLKAVIAEFETPEIAKTLDIEQQVLLIACQLVEKIVHHKVQNESCYQQWAQQLISSTYGHNFPVLHINQQDYSQLEHYQLLDMVKDKVSSVIVKEVPRFSFHLVSDNGVSGHDSVAAIKQIELLLTANKRKQDALAPSN